MWTKYFKLKYSLFYYRTNRYGIQATLELYNGDCYNKVAYVDYICVCNVSITREMEN